MHIKRMDNDFHIPDFLHTFFDIENGKTLQITIGPSTMNKTYTVYKDIKGMTKCMIFLKEKTKRTISVKVN